MSKVPQVATAPKVGDYCIPEAALFSAEPCDHWKIIAVGKTQVGALDVALVERVNSAVNSYAPTVYAMPVKKLLAFGDGAEIIKLSIPGSSWYAAHITMRVEAEKQRAVSVCAAYMKDAGKKSPHDL